MKRWLVAVVIIAVIAVGVGAFFGGKASGGTPSPQEALKVLTNLTAAQRQSLFANGSGLGQLFGGTRGAGAGAGPANGSGGFTTGTIVSSDSNSVTVKLSDGSTKIVLYAPSTVIAVSKTGSSSDLTAGQDVTVTGTANSDGSITATRIQVGTLPRPTTRTTGTESTGQAGDGTVTTAGAGTTTQ